MRWPSVEKLKKSIKLPSGFELHQLEKCEIKSVILKLKQWYPAIRVGSESRHLKKEFYLQHVYLKNGNQSRNIYPFVIKNTKKQLVGFYSIEINRLSKSMSGPLGAIDPKFRTYGISKIFAPLMIKVAKLMAIELLHGYATLQHPYIQQNFEEMGFIPVGIVPAFDRDRMEDGKVRRVPEVIYAKVLSPKKGTVKPKANAMTSQVCAIWNFLFADNIS